VNIALTTKRVLRLVCIFSVCLFLLFNGAAGKTFWRVLYLNSHLTLSEYSLNREEGVASGMYVFCLSISFVHWPRREKFFGLLYLNPHLTLSECNLNINKKTI
jgi:hypothetical protein